MLKAKRLKRLARGSLAELDERIRRYYQSIESSGYFETLDSVDIWEDTKRRSHFLRFCGEASSILDFGCGSGGLAVGLKERFPDKEVIALDLGESSGGKIGRGARGIEFHRGDALASPFEDGRFDMVINRFVIEHSVFPEKLVSEIHRILRPGGVLYLIYPQLLLRVDPATFLFEVCSWISPRFRLTYLDPELSDSTAQADDRDAVWLSNPVKVRRMIQAAGFDVVVDRPVESLMVGRKPRVGA